MYGNTADSYRQYARVGEPYKKGGSLYIKVIHPKTKREKEVRWYTDPNHKPDIPDTPLHLVFGFRSVDDQIIAIKEADLTPEEVEEHFAYKWRNSTIFGGVWYAPEGTPLSLVGKNYFHPTWQEFHAAGQANSISIGFPESCWFQDVSI
jgi:hypothetical protein